ncbi:MAG: hypothetical protein ACWGN7_05385, partial [Thermodesulfovibrionales bacterium]
SHHCLTSFHHHAVRTDMIPRGVHAIVTECSHFCNGNIIASTTCTFFGMPSVRHLQVIEAADASCCSRHCEGSFDAVSGNPL